MLDIKKLVFIIFIIAMFPESVANVGVENKRYISITFDDGPHPHYTESIVRILKRHNVPATFFLVGKQIEKYPHLLRLIVEAGFEVGSHSFSHTSFKNMKIKDIVDENERFRRVVMDLTGYSARVLRPPGGYINSAINYELAKNGWRVVLWDVYPKDIASAEDEIFESVIKDVKENDIILLHSGVNATLRVLDRLILRLKKMGFEFLTAGEIIKTKELHIAKR